MRRLSAFTLIDLAMLLAASTLLVAIGLPVFARARELSQRTVCAGNLMGIGAGAKIYATDNKDLWPVPPFKRDAIDEEGVDYLTDTDPLDPYPVAVGFLREYPSYSETPIDPGAGSTEMSVTRAYWMLVRSGDLSIQQFICPSNSSDFHDPTVQIDLYYDFSAYSNVSYGYQVPFGPRDTQPREGAGHRQIFAADKGPYYLPDYNPDFLSAGENGSLGLDDPPARWRPFNSFNHGGRAIGEGQNVLFAGGHVSFTRIPAIGVDDDNLYTLMIDEWSSLPYNRIHGDPPHRASTGSAPYPGQNALGTGAGKYSSTDSLIYP